MDAGNALLGTLKMCDDTEFKDWIIRLLSNLNMANYQWLSATDDGYYLTAIDNTDAATILIAARHYSMLMVDINEIRQFVDKLTLQEYTKGMFITTSSFSTDAKRYIQDMKVNISLIDGGVMTRYLQQGDLFCISDKTVVEAKPIAVSNKQNASEGKTFRLREQKKLLRVTFPDGTVFCAKSASQTFLQTIKHIGAETVASLGLELCHIPLVSQSVNERYKEWTKPIGDGWYAMLQSDTEQKYIQLTSINKQLQLNLIIEMKADFKANSSNGNKHGAKKPKSQLMITFSDGRIVAGFNTTDTFVAFVEYIGVDKIAKTHISMAGLDLVTPTQKYSGQVQLNSGKWLTVPNTTKDKYKIAKVISSMTYTKCEITII